MTLDTFLILWSSTTLAILLVVELQFPWSPVRRWLARAPELITDPYGREWIVRREGVVICTPQPTKAEAWRKAEVSRGDRVKAVARDWGECSWCAGAWLAAAAVGTAAVAQDSEALMWWPVVWLASSASVVIIDAIAER